MNKDMLLIDCVGYAMLTLNESAGGACRFQGKFQEANKENKNRRVYPKDVLETSVNRLQETIEGRGLYGELDHPTDSIIHLANASHIVTKLWWEGDILMGEGEILNTPSGKVLRSIIEGGGRIGMSSRGVGNGQPDDRGVLVIGESYKLITFDAVADPSTYSAFQTKVTGKKESYEVNDSVEPRKKLLNPNAVVSYFGSLMESKLNEIKKKL